MKEQSLDNIFGFKLYRSFSLIKAEIFKRFYHEGINVNFEQWIILNRLWDQDGLNQKELLELTMQSKGNLTRTLKTMEKLGLIIRKKDPNDLRSIQVYLTSQSKRFKGKLRKIAFEVLSQSTFGLTDKELEITHKVLDKIVQNF